MSSYLKEVVARQHKVHIIGEAPEGHVAFIDWYSIHHGIFHNLTFKFVDAYGAYSVSGKTIECLETMDPVNIITAGSLIRDSFRCLRIVIYTKAPELIANFQPTWNLSPLHTLVHEIVHYEQFRTNGKVHHNGIDNRIEILLQEFRRLVCCTC